MKSAPGRARQLAAGANLARGDTILFLHADTRLPPGWDASVRAALADPRVVGGAFRLRFEQRSPALRLIEWGARLRVRPLAHALRRPGAVRAPQRRSRRWAACRRPRSWRTSIWCGAEAARAGSRCLRPAVDDVGAPLPRGRGAARHVCATGWRPRPGGWACRASASRRGISGERDGRSARRSASPLRRLRGYVLRNRGYYAVWTATTLGYVAGFVAVPILVGWSVKAVVDGLPRAGGGAARARGSRR